jgi:hypothetical protein
MSLELVNTFATLGTFTVIAATAIAAIVQLRHARSSNHIAALNELRETQESADFRDAKSFVNGALSAKLEDPAFRHQIEVVEARTGENWHLIAKVNAVGNYYEHVGVLVIAGLIERELLLQASVEPILAAWRDLAQVAAIHRRRAPGVWENFEYLTVLAQDWMAAHPKGTYPAGVRRIDLKDEWLDADKRYTASLAPV